MRAPLRGVVPGQKTAHVLRNVSPETLIHCHSKPSQKNACRHLHPVEPKSSRYPLASPQTKLHAPRKLFSRCAGVGCNDDDDDFDACLGRLDDMEFNSQVAQIKTLHVHLLAHLYIRRHCVVMF